MKTIRNDQTIPPDVRALRLTRQALALLQQAGQIADSAAAQIETARHATERAALDLEYYAGRTVEGSNAMNRIGLT